MSRRFVRKYWLTLLIFSIVVIMFCSSKLQEAKCFAGYEQVVRAVKAGQLRPDAQGDLQLPVRWAWLTANGHVYRCKDQTGGLVLLFPTDVTTIHVDWGDKTIDNRQIAGYIYCWGTIPEDTWFSFAGMEGVRAIEAERLPPHWLYAEPFYS